MEICSSLAPPRRKRQRQIVERGHMVEQPEILEHDADPAPQQRRLRPVELGDVAAEKH